MKFLAAIVLGLVLSLSAFAQGGMMPGPGTPHSGGGGGACGVGSDIFNGWCQIAHTTVGGNTATVTTPSLNTTGADLIVIKAASFCGGGHTLVVGDVSDNKSDTWTSISSQCDGGGTQAILLVYSKPSTVGSGHTFSIAHGDTTFPTIEVYAVSGSHATPLDQVAAATSGGSSVTSLATSSITPTQNNELIISGWSMLNPNTGTPTVNAGMTVSDFLNGAGGVNVTGGMAYITQSTAAAINPTWSWASSGPAWAAIVSFKHS